MAFDECTPGTAEYDYAKGSMERTQRWLLRCVKRFDETEPFYGYNQTLFPLVQGCVYPKLRSESAKFIADLGREGNAIGGLAVGEPTEKMYEMIEVVNMILPADKPRYLMGVGTPDNILEAIERGTSDCWADRYYSKAYLHHLVMCDELLGLEISSLHNLAFYLRLVNDARQHIINGDFIEWKHSVVDNLKRRVKR